VKVLRAAGDQNNEEEQMVFQVQQGQHEEHEAQQEQESCENRADDQRPGAIDAIGHQAGEHNFKPAKADKNESQAAQAPVDAREVRGK
jgi:hypothetical protein